MNELTDSEIFSIWWITYGYEPINWHTFDPPAEWYEAMEKKGYIKKYGKWEGYRRYHLTEKIQELLKEKENENQSK